MRRAECVPSMNLQLVRVTRHPGLHVAVSGGIVHIEASHDAHECPIWWSTGLSRRLEKHLQAMVMRSVHTPNERWECHGGFYLPKVHSQLKLR